MVTKHLYLVLLVTIFFEIAIAAEAFDCWEGRCWTYCTAVGHVIPGAEEWCYTTKSSSQDYNYVDCNADSECQRNWSCAGPCTV
ncbi:unnamed protein product [Cunninghamella echinulata]